LAIRISKNRRTSYIYLGHYVDTKYWDAQKKTTQKIQPNSAHLNNFLEIKLAETGSVVNNLVDMGTISPTPFSTFKQRFCEDYNTSMRSLIFWKLWTLIKPMIPRPNKNTYFKLKPNDWKDCQVFYNLKEFSYALRRAVGFINPPVNCSAGTFKNRYSK